MDNDEKLNEFENEVIKTFQNPDGSMFKKFRSDALKNMIKNKDYPGLLFFLENIMKRYDGLSPKFIRRLGKYEKGYADSFRKGVEIIKAAKKAEIEMLIEKLKKIEEDAASKQKIVK
jgi:hypothetical protein